MNDNRVSLLYLNWERVVREDGSIANGKFNNLNNEREVKATEDVRGFFITAGYREKQRTGTK